MTLPSLSVLGAAWGVSEFCLMLARRSKSDSGCRDRNSLRLLWVVILMSIGLGILAAWRLPAWALPWRKLFYAAGCSFFVLGLIFRWYSIIYLGRLFTPDVAIAADHRLIDTGPYRFIRHPTYAGALLTFLGVSLSFGNLVSLLVTIMPILAALLWRIRIEEAALIEAFGEQYRNYMQRTKRLIPLVY